MDHEKLIAKKYGLFWSNAWIGGENEEDFADGFYVSRHDMCFSIFYVILEKLAEVNDYCFYQLFSSERKLSELRQGLSQLEGKRNVGAEEFHFYHDSIYTWEGSAAVISNAVPIVLLSSFVEWGLKEIAKEYCSSIPKKNDPRISDIQFLIKHIKASCDLDFIISKETLETINLFRKIRNEFAHGKWEEIDKSVKTIFLRDCFSAVSDMFHVIEQSVNRKYPPCAPLA